MLSNVLHFPITSQMHMLLHAFLLIGILMSNVRNLLSIEFYFVASAGLCEAHHADSPLQG